MSQIEAALNNLFNIALSIGIFVVVLGIILYLLTSYIF
jgi:hypothetical protein